MHLSLSFSSSHSIVSIGCSAPASTLVSSRGGILHLPDIDRWRSLWICRSICSITGRPRNSIGTCCAQILPKGAREGGREGGREIERERERERFALRLRAKT